MKKSLKFLCNKQQQIGQKKKYIHFTVFDIYKKISIVTRRKIRTYGCVIQITWGRGITVFFRIQCLLVSVQPCRQCPSLQSSQLSHCQYKCCLRQELLHLKHKHLWPTYLFMLKTGYLENWRPEVTELNVNEEMQVDDSLFDRDAISIWVRKCIIVQKCLMR